MEKQQVVIELHVNPLPYKLTVNPSTIPLELLRQDLGLKGAKRGCDQGNCGACTVLPEVKAVNACTLAGWNREVEESKGVQCKRHGSIIAWWATTCCD